LPFGASGFIIKTMKQSRFNCVVISALAVAFTCQIFAAEFYSTSSTVGRNGDVLVTPANQIVRPVGKFIELPNMRPQALALSPDGKLLVTA
jgi:hypothetical protein